LSVFCAGLAAGCGSNMPTPLIRSYNSKIVKPDEMGNIVVIVVLFWNFCNCYKFSGVFLTWPLATSLTAVKITDQPFWYAYHIQSTFWFTSPASSQTTVFSWIAPVCRLM